MACKVQEKRLPLERNRPVNDINRRRNHQSYKDNWYYSQSFENDNRRRFHHKNKQEYGRYRGSFNRSQFKRSGTCNRSPRSWNNRYNGGRGSNFYEGEKRQNFRNFTKPLPPSRALKPAAVTYGWQNESTFANTAPLPRDRYQKKDYNKCYNYSNDSRGHGNLNDTSYYSNNNRSMCQMNGVGLNNFIFLVDSPNFKSERLQRHNHINGHRTQGQSLLQNSNYSRRPNWCFKPRRRHSICDNSWCYSENSHREKTPPRNKVHSDSSNYVSHEVKKNYNMHPTVYANEENSYSHNERTQNAWVRQLEKPNHNHHAYQLEHGWYGSGYGPNMKFSHHNNIQAWRERNSTYTTKETSNIYTQESRKYSKPSFAEVHAKSSSRKEYVRSKEPPKQKFIHCTSENNKNKKQRRNIAWKTGNKRDKADKTKGLRSSPRGKELEEKETDENSKAAIRCNLNKEDQGSDFPHEKKLDVVGSSSCQGFEKIERFSYSKPECVSSTTKENLADVKESWNMPYEEYVPHAELDETASENHTPELEISSLTYEVDSLIYESKSPYDKRSSFTSKPTSPESELNSLTCEVNSSEFKSPTSECKSSFNEENNDVFTPENSTLVKPAIFSANSEINSDHEFKSLDQEHRSLTIEKRCMQIEYDTSSIDIPWMACEVNVSTSEYKFPTNELSLATEEFGSLSFDDNSPSMDKKPVVDTTQIFETNYSLVNDQEDTTKSLEIPGNCQEINSSNPRLDKRGIISIEQSSSSPLDSQEVETEEVMSELSTDNQGHQRVASVDTFSNPPLGY